MSGAPSIPFATAARAALALGDQAVAEALDPGDHDGVIIDPDVLELRRLELRLRELASRRVRAHLWAEAWADIERFVKLAGLDVGRFREAARELDKREREALAEFERWAAEQWVKIKMPGRDDSGPLALPSPSEQPAPRQPSEGTRRRLESLGKLASDLRTPANERAAALEQMQRISSGFQ